MSYRNRDMTNIFKDLSSKRKKYSNREIPVEEVLKDAGLTETSSLNVCPECDTPLKIQLEPRYDGLREMMYYCDGCGYTASAKA